MADLYGNNVPSSSFESEEMSSFLHNLLQNSSSTTASSLKTFKPQHINLLTSPSPTPQPPAARIMSACGSFRRSEAIPPDSDCRVGKGASTGLAGSSFTFNLSDPSDYFPTNAKESSRNFLSDAITSAIKGSEFPTEENVDAAIDFACEGAEASDGTGKSVRLRSSKRSRAAEVHNMSEKRRRSRINEKLRALLNLIPNSSKTDKASMLDDAIEYLKQLQLQVQTLMMRNGLNLHSLHLSGSDLSLQLPQKDINFDDGNILLNSIRGTHTFPRNQEISFQNAFDISNQAPLNQPIIGSNFIEFDPSIDDHYGLLNHLKSPKDIYRSSEVSSQLQLDTSCSGKILSPGASS